MNAEIVEAFKEMAREKNVSREQLVDIIESTFEMMIKKKFGTSDNFDIIVNMDKGEIEIYQVKEVVDEVEDPALQILLADAQEAEPELDPLTLRFTVLIDKVLALPGFQGERDKCNEKILEAIQMIWLEEFREE